MRLIQSLAAYCRSAAFITTWDLSAMCCNLYFAGVPCILMSPVAFLQRPLRSLQAISRYQATTSGGPNFAYELCMRKIRSLKTGADST